VPLLAHVICLTLTLGLLARAAQEPKNDFHFSIIGDRTGSAQPEVYSRVWREVDLLRPDFVINVGDTIEGGNLATAEGQWTEVMSIWKKYNAGLYPYYSTPGNHDIWLDKDGKENKSEAIYREQTHQAPYYAFNYQDAHFAILDNSRTQKLSDAQLMFLETDLAANKDRKPKFVFFHKPYWIPFVRAGNKEEPLHRICKQNDVDYVISGHGHQFVYMPFDGIKYMEVGSSGGKMGGLARGEGFSQGWFYHHVWARVRNGRVDLTVKEIDGPQGKGRMFRAEDWVNSAPHFNPDDPASSEDPKG
jgi:UDP-2,3-diacylglucosamine pyrophosphatase LpxH